jgi:hypothetical protein
MQTSSYATFTDALQASGHDFEPEMHQVFLPDGRAIPDCQAIVRSDNSQPLGITGNKHCPVAYRETAAVLDREFSGALKDLSVRVYGGGAQASFTGTVKGGEVSIRTPRRVGDIVSLGISVATSVDGSMKRRVIAGVKRLVCLNGMAALDAKASVNRSSKHTRNGQRRFEAAAFDAAAVIAPFLARAQDWQRMADTSVSDATFKAYATNILAGQGVEGVLAAIDARPSFGVADILDATEERDNPSKALEAILEAYESAPGAEPGTAWGAYQAVSHYLTHTAGRSEETRAHSLLLGPNAQRLAVAEQVALQLTRR